MRFTVPKCTSSSGLLTRIAIAAHGAVVLVPHPSLTGITSGTGLSGSTQWHNAVRARAYLKKLKPKRDHDGTEDDPLDSNLRVLEFHKNQAQPMGCNPGAPLFPLVADHARRYAASGRR